MKFVLAATALLIVASTDARRLSGLPNGQTTVLSNEQAVENEGFKSMSVSYMAKMKENAAFPDSSKSGKSDKSGKSEESGKNDDRLKELEAEFPCLAPFANKTVVDQYTEKPNTALRSTGLIAEVNGGFDDFNLQTRYDQRISKSEVKQICATKCTNVLEDCTIFGMIEDINDEGKIRYDCFFYSDDSIASQFSVVNPVKSNLDITSAANYNFSVFYKGEDLVLPKFVGCDVPVGKAASLAVTCSLYEYQYGEFQDWPPALLEDCKPVLENLTPDFEDYILPSVQCTLREVDADGLQKCLTCLATDAYLGCSGDEVCEEADNIITKKCPDTPDTCTSTGKVNKCGTCGNVCPQEKTCVAKLKTALLCQAGANPKYDSEGQFGSCMNADNADFPEAYLATKGNGDYKCLNKTAVPDWV